VERGSDAADQGNVTFEEWFDSALHEGNSYNDFRAGSTDRYVHVVFS
jgi:hypothetical protein